jgi:hypothetical protein
VCNSSGGVLSWLRSTADGAKFGAIANHAAAGELQVKLSNTVSFKITTIKGHMYDVEC